MHGYRWTSSDTVLSFMDVSGPGGWTGLLERQWSWTAGYLALAVVLLLTGPLTTVTTREVD
jgi:hypothetical protein